MEKDLEVLLETEVVAEGEQNALASASLESSSIKLGCGICCC